MKICVLLILASAAIAAAQDYSSGSNYYGAPMPYAPLYASGIDKDALILRNDQEIKPDGSYHYAYETSNGISGAEQGVGGVAVQGSSSYTSPEGVEIKLTYTADENGYHPVGDHIPKIPDYILRSLEYIRTHPYQVRDYYSGQTKRATQSAVVPGVATYMLPPTQRPKRYNRLLTTHMLPPTTRPKRNNRPTPPPTSYVAQPSNEFDFKKPSPEQPQFHIGARK